jgi:vancomycin resistance protein YoaR
MAQARRRRRRREQKKKLNKSLPFTKVVITVAIGAVGVVGLSIGVHSLLSTTSSINLLEESDDKVLKYIDKQSNKEIYFNNISIDGVDVGGLTKVEARTKLSSEIKMPENSVVAVVSSEDGKFSQTYSEDDFSLSFDMEGAIESAYNYGRGGTDEENVAALRLLESTPQNFEVMSYDATKLQTIADDISAKLSVEPVNASVSKSSSGFTVTPHTTGYSVDTEQIVSELQDVIDNRRFGEDVKFTITQLDPKYTEDDFKYIDNVIGTCYSSYSGGDDNRIANLKNACSKIDGVVLYPDEVFSTNDHFNPCTYENGWRDAGTIVQGKIENSIGGGMCQVSSALYDAVLEAELEVTERYNHSLKVGYSDWAFDATLAGDYKDLKFKNNTGYPMFIESYLSSSQVVVKLYGYEVHDAGHTVKYKNKFIKTTEPDEPKITYDDTKYEDEEECVVTAINGQTYELYKYVYENGVQQGDPIKVNTSVYVPRRAEYVKGTKKRETATPQETTPTEETPQSTDTSDTAVAQPEAVAEDNAGAGN